MTESSYVVPSQGRSIVTDTGLTLKIEIPPERNWFTFLFLSFWLVGWAVGELLVGGILLSGLLAIISSGEIGSLPSASEGFVGVFLLAWFGGWTVGGVFAIRAWLWMGFGREIIVVARTGIELRKRTLGQGKSQRYDPTYINNLRVEASDSPRVSRRGMNFGGATSGPLAFDYGADTVHFGSALSNGEATALFKQMQEKLYGRGDVRV